MEGQVPFKVYTFWTANGSPEVRRFNVENGAASNFTYMNSKILEHYPGLKNNKYSIGWKDEEGDYVTISTDEELLTALCSMSGNLTKLYVYCKEKVNDEHNFVTVNMTSQNTASGDGISMPHLGVICDSCDRPVVGFRYNCTSCEDYDLCSTCEASGAHPEHCMVRVPAPVMPRALIRAAIKRSRHFLKTVSGNVGVECPFKKHKVEKNERKHGEHHRDRHDRRRHGDFSQGDKGDHHRRPRGSWLETFATYMNEYANLAGDLLHDDSTQAKSNDSETQNPTQNQQNTTESQPGTSANAPEECPFVPNVNVEQISKLLEYLGGGLQNLATPPPSEKSDVKMQDGVSTQIPKSTEMDVTNKTEEDSVAVKSERDASPDKVEGWTVINSDKDLMDTDVPTAPSEPIPPIGFNLPKEFQERVTISEGQNLYPPLNSATAELGSQKVEPTSSQTIPTQQKPTATAESKTPSAAANNPAQAAKPEQPKKRHPKAHIESAIQQMLSMGFTNEGDWLTQLLESKDGNIAAVLDLLTPVNPKQ